jgi:hypothetical protein
MHTLRVLLPLLASLALLPVAAAAQEVTIYRCIGPGDTLTLRDSPCEVGEKQQARSMQRPRDPAPAAGPIVPPAAPVAPVAQREVQVIYRSAPRPMYECVTGDGDRYTSDNGEGNPRLVPAWAAGYQRWEDGRGGPNPRGQAIPTGSLLRGAEVWVRDECHALPQQEVCARLSDRRYEIIRRYNSALQSERRDLELEQRGIDARISSDCGN